MGKLSYQASRRKLGALDCVVVGPAADQEVAAVAVFCHGFGAGGDDLVGLAGELLEVAACEKPLQLVFPAAPLSLEEQGMPGARAWWLLSIQRLLSAIEEGRYEQVRDEVPEGIEEARKLLVTTVEEAMELAGVGYDRLLLGGFSQGAMLSVETACLGLKSPPAQLCLYSGALISEKRWKSAAGRLKDSQIFQSHGKLDPILPFQTGVWLREMLQEHQCRVDFLEFNGPHTIPFEAIERTGFMLAQLAE